MTKAMKWAGAVLGLLLWSAAHAGTVTYVYTDAQGTPVMESDAQGHITARFEYTPYGVVVTSMGAAPDGVGYTGHVNDPETGLVYMQARYYDPMGRMLSVDPVGPTPGNVFSFNRYAYANNNPIVNIDPDGRQAEESVARVEEDFREAQAASRFMPAEKPIDPLISQIRASGFGVDEILHPVNKILDVLEKIPNKDLKDPPGKRGNAPIGNDGHPVEIHHDGQKSSSPLVELTRTDHRGGENYKKNHRNTGEHPSEIERKEWRKQQKQYWRNEWDKGRFHDMKSSASGGS